MRLAFDIARKNVWLAIIPVAALIASLYYLNFNYYKLKHGVEYFSVEFKKPISIQAPVAYITDSTDVRINFYEHFQSLKQNDSVYTIKLSRKTKLRQFRLYFSDSIDHVIISRIVIGNNYYKTELPLTKFHIENGKILQQDKAKLSFVIASGTDNTFIESSQFYYPSDSATLLIASIFVAVLSLLIFLLIRTVGMPTFNQVTLEEIGVFAFISSFFLPQKVFNVTLAFSTLLVLRNFRLQHFLRNRINFIFISIYCLILLSFLLGYPETRFKEIEKYLLFLVLPIYVSCIQIKSPLLHFCISALLIGGVLLSTALIDISIFRNIEVVSFINFTRRIHPVYYSYLLMVSIFYVEYCVFKKHKYLIQVALILLLILSGSKLIILSTVFWFIFFVRKPMSVAISSIIILLLLVFAPTKERFGSIMNFSDLSIIADQKIQNPDDPRLNGFTLRIILWQESLRLQGVKELLFGKGVGAPGNIALKANLKQRGLTKHMEFNAHNQFVTTLQKTGIMGLVLLISLLVYCIKWGIKTHNMLLIAFTSTMSVAMLSESVFERASGTAFFCMGILLLINSEFLDPKKIGKEEIG